MYELIELHSRLTILIDMKFSLLAASAIDRYIYGGLIYEITLFSVLFFQKLQNLLQVQSITEKYDRIAQSSIAKSFQGSWDYLSLLEP